MYQKIKSSDKYWFQQLTNEAVEVAELLPSVEGLVLVQGTCELYYLLQRLVDPNDELLSDRKLMSFEDDCQSLPVLEHFREKCSPQYLAESEPRIQELACRARPIVAQKCPKILSRFERKDLGLLESELADGIEFGP